MSAGIEKKADVTHAQARPYFYFIVIMLVLLIPGVSIAVSDLTLTLGRVEFNQLIAEDVYFDADMGSRESVVFSVSASRVSLSATLVIEHLEIHCDEGRLDSVMLSCVNGTYQGTLREYGDISGPLAFSYRLDGRAGHLTLPEVAIGTGLISSSMDSIDGNWTLSLQGRQLELAVLHKLADVVGIWPTDYTGENGTIDIDAKLAGNVEGLDSLQGDLKLHAVSFYGASAAESLSGEMHFNLRLEDGWRVSGVGEIADGAVFIDSGITVGNISPGIALEITGQAFSFALDMDIDRSQHHVKLYQLDIDHPDVMSAHLQLDADRDADISINSAAVELTVHNADAFYTTYLQPFLLDTQFNNLALDGTLVAEARLDTTGITRLDLQLDNVHAQDNNGRYNIAGLNGSIRITDAITPVESSLSWDNAGLYRLIFGAGNLGLESSAQSINIVSWDDVPVLDGQLHINSLSIESPGGADMTIKLDGALTPVAMDKFTDSMGWPVMSGELTAAIGGLTYHQGNLMVDGEIHLGLFGGNVNIRKLRIEDLFGLVPTLFADIDIDMLDLELLTNRFTFGQIQGHISGTIHKLELQAWEPVYFEAQLSTPKDDPTRHRISQKAVENLGYIGGGAGGALSSGFLRIFKNYSYGDIGISCRLYNGTCVMGGVKATPDGFIIVSRGGVLPPWIEVKGTGHSIDWITLIEGLRTITTNQPEFE